MHYSVLCEQLCHPAEKKGNRAVLRFGHGKTPSVHDDVLGSPDYSSARTCWRHDRRSIAQPACLPDLFVRSEEHTSELQSRFDLVCRLLLEKKKKVIQ